MQTADKFVVRLPDGLRDEIKGSAQEAYGFADIMIAARKAGA